MSKHLPGLIDRYVNVPPAYRSQKDGEDVTVDERLVEGLAAGRYYAIAIAREGFRKPANAGPRFFELLSQSATLFTIGDDDRRTVDLTLWRWPE